MRYKATFLTGFGVGYVLGSRAGRERYEQIAQAARGLAESPAVQSAAGVLQAKAGQAVGSAKTVVTDKVTERIGGRDVTVDLTPYDQPATAGEGANGTV